MIDLRSDTVTLPTKEMRIAMADAHVGDDVYREDETINHLEKMSAELMGKEEGLFLTSGTMGNLIAILTTCQRGDEVIMGDCSHTFLHEVGGISALGGVMAHTLPNLPNGTIDINRIQEAIRGADIHEPSTRMVVIENTHNRCGGVAISKEYIDQIGVISQNYGLSFHMDGARIFNASIKLNEPVKSLIQNVDSITFCLSKGLGAPVGSVLCGTADFIQKARKIRKQLGGGMRQAGIIAAGGVYALNHNINRLINDHRRANVLAIGLQSIEGIDLAPNTPQTNMVFLNIRLSENQTIDQIQDDLRTKGILVGVAGKQSLRLVTHLGISDEDIQKVISGFMDLSKDYLN
ncbi:MAG: low-specificity L-threonine aldolase [Anaerolineaceae bacterium]